LVLDDEVRSQKRRAHEQHRYPGASQPPVDLLPPTSAGPEAQIGPDVQLPVPLQRAQHLQQLVPPTPAFVAAANEDPIAPFAHRRHPDPKPHRPPDNAAAAPSRPDSFAARRTAPFSPAAPLRPQSHLISARP